MLARLEKSEQRGGDGREPRTDDLAMRAALDRRDRILQRVMGRAAHHAVDERSLELLRHRRLAVRHGRIQHGGAAQQRWIHEPMHARPGATDMRHAGSEALLAVRAAIGWHLFSPRALF